MTDVESLQIKILSRGIGITVSVHHRHLPYVEINYLKI